MILRKGPYRFYFYSNEKENPLIYMYKENVFLQSFGCNPLFWES